MAVPIQCALTAILVYAARGGHSAAICLKGHPTESVRSEIIALVTEANVPYASTLSFNEGDTGTLVVKLQLAKNRRAPRLVIHTLTA